MRSPGARHPRCPTTSASSTRWPASCSTTATSIGDTYDAARDLLGDRGVVEIVTLCGYYTLVSFTLNAFDVALPPGEAPTWPAEGG